MWCVPKVDEEYLTRMEDVLDTLAKPVDEREPVVALDERPVQLLDSARQGTPMAPGRLARRDYEYVRHGTANIFCIVAPKIGGHLTHATRDRKAPRFADAVKRIADAYPKARTIHLVMDNLNTHCEKSLAGAFGELEGRRLWRRFTVHHTPKHASWLNPAEIEVSLWSRECLGRDRVATFAELSRRTRSWTSAPIAAAAASIGGSPPPMHGASLATSRALCMGQGTRGTSAVSPSARHRCHQCRTWSSAPPTGRTYRTREATRGAPSPMPSPMPDMEGRRLAR